MKTLSNMRPALKRLGDDVSLTRWVKLPERHTLAQKTALMAENASGTRFPSRVLRVNEMPNLLVSGYLNIKIGRDVRKGKFRGYRIFTLSLEERKTCPQSCQHWRSCYGNAMPFAKRIDHTDPAFLPALEAEIARLMAKPWPGVLIRLHALGDFYSCEYVSFWDRQLQRHPKLSIYGYSAHPNKSAIGWTLHHLRMEWGYRAMIRMSNAPYPVMSTVTIGTPESRPANAFICPEQTRQTQCCATCGLCWSTRKNVAFLEH